MGDKPNMIPVSLDVQSSTNAKNHYNVELPTIVTHLILMSYAVVNAITAANGCWR
jgi:hypothetical protein